MCVGGGEDVWYVLCVVFRYVCGVVVWNLCVLSVNGE